jgi:hypothetical protein
MVGKLAPQRTASRAVYTLSKNRMALLWPDKHLTVHYFRSLLGGDTRTDRRGFTATIVIELEALRSFYAPERWPRASHHGSGLLETLGTVLSAGKPSPFLR